jgi:hypothetical protein
MTCGLFGSGQATAECLRLDDLWYNVFEVSPYIIHSDISIAVLQTTESIDAKSSQAAPAACAEFAHYREFNLTCIDVLDVGNSNSGSVGTSGLVTANYIGDFAVSQALRDLTGKYMLAPESRSLTSQIRQTHPQLLLGLTDWMLIDKSNFDFSGKSLNVSFVAITLVRDSI